MKVPSIGEDYTVDKIVKYMVYRSMVSTMQKNNAKRYKDCWKDLQISVVATEKDSFEHRQHSSKDLKEVREPFGCLAEKAFLDI